MLSVQTKAVARRVATARHLKSHTEDLWRMMVCSWCSVPGTRYPSYRARLGRVSTSFVVIRLGQRRHCWLGSSNSAASRLLLDTAGSDTEVFVVEVSGASVAVYGDTVADKKGAVSPCAPGLLLECSESWAGVSQAATCSVLDMCCKALCSRRYSWTETGIGVEVGGVTWD